MPKKILIHSLIFSPDGVSTAYLYNDIALKFQENGYEVLVLTTTPHYNVVESQLAAQPLKWKVWGICKESCFLLLGYSQLQHLQSLLFLPPLQVCKTAYCIP